MTRRCTVGVGLAFLGVLAGCPTDRPAEPIVDGGKPHTARDAQSEAAISDAESDLGASHDARLADAARADVARADAARPDTRVADGARPDTAVHDSGGVDTGLADGAVGDGASDAGVAHDAAGEDGGFPPLLKVVVHQDSWSDEMTVDWMNPDGDACENWTDPDQCDWGAYGQISISGDDRGYIDEDWAEISQVSARDGMYQALVRGYFCDTNGCFADRVRIYLDGAQVQVLNDTMDVEWNSYVCMPLVAGQWDTAHFRWKTSSCQ